MTRMPIEGGRRSKSVRRTGRIRPRRLGLLIAGAAIAAAFLPCEGSRAEGVGETLGRWAEGPVRYLLSRSEEQEYAELKDDRQRALFVARFWQQWDPTPRTLENETRRAYWLRVQEANRRFRETVRPGWMTDRGRIYILLGEPDDIELDDSPGIGDGFGAGAFSGGGSLATRDRGRESEFDREDSTARGLLRWIYRTVPGKTVDPNLIVAFTRDTSGEWRISRNPENYTAAFPSLSGSSSDTTFGGVLTTKADATAGGAGTETGGPIEGTTLVEDAIEVFNSSDLGRASLIALDLGEALRIPTPAELAGDYVTAKEFLGRIPIVSRLAFFKAADGNTRVQVGASAPAREVYRDLVPPEDAESFLLLYARFNPEDSEDEVIFATNEESPARVRGRDLQKPGARVEAWVGRTLSPGSWRMALGLQDVSTGAVTSYGETIDVPALADRSPSMSSILPVYRLEETDGETIPEPRVLAEFARSDDFAVYYQVYNLTERDGRRDFEIHYRFFMRDGATQTPIGNPVVYGGQSGQVHGWSFPLAEWPPGTYKLEVLVKDTIGGGQARGSLDFVVR